MNYPGMTVLKLKQLCKERGLRIAGNKDEVIIRLMEDDESKEGPVSQIIQQAPVMYQVAPTHQVANPDDQNPLMIMIGMGIIVYSIFRGGMGFMFLSEGEEIIASVIALMIAGVMMTGGLLTALNYRNGLSMTIVILIISGSLSLLASGDINPLSIAFDGDGGIMHIFSMMCSAVCIVIVGLPLLTSMSTLKPGWPGGLNDMMNRFQTDKKVTYECPSCDQELRVPASYSGQAKCPSCKESMEI
ncbi:MAG TPA: hypothetical protein EYQ73_02150 [Candidatus Poseidoniales archaeon]|jgi:hypothetical protein|nr:hypothetical protein [Candidatus Poseidoniales archaeon]